MPVADDAKISAECPDASFGSKGGGGEGGKEQEARRKLGPAIAITTCQDDKIMWYL